MNADDWFQLIVYLSVLLLLAIPLGRWMAVVLFARQHRLLQWQTSVERAFAKVCGFDADEQMNWRRYAAALLLFNALGLLAVYGLQRTQQWLPMNARSLGPVSPDLAFNTAVSFATNTNWQAYSGESTMSALTQILALTVQNFLSAATGIAVLIVLIRGLIGGRKGLNRSDRAVGEVSADASSSTNGLGSFWIDLIRSVLFILLPLSMLLAVVLVSQGVVQTLGDSLVVPLLNPTTAADSTAVDSQSIPLGMAASQVAIKQLGTNGGGFYGVNSAHPLENPTPLSNFLQLLAILLIPAALCETFGVLVGDVRQGRVLLAAMLLIFVPCLVVAEVAEHSGNPAINQLIAETGGDAGTPAATMEGKEVRFGTTQSVLWAVATTAASNGSVNSMHDSMTPLGGLIPMWLMQVGEVIFGGVGCGLYGMIIFAIVAVFIAGLMVGRTPEYLGKKIEAREMKLAALVILIPSALVLTGTAAAVMTQAGKVAVSNTGPHAFSQILYAVSSAANNNGSAFAGLAVNSVFYNLLLGTAMLFSRYWLIIPVLAIAGSLGNKGRVPVTAGTLPTHTPLFAFLLAGIVVLVGALTFLPALVLGPVAEHFSMTR